MGRGDCGLARTFSQRSRDKHQLTALAARIAELRQKLAALPENALTLTADEVAVAMEQQAQSRAFRQRLTSLHARYQPLQKRLRQNGESVQKAQAQQAALNETLALRRQQYKEKISTTRR